jgi:hypothetical protein
MAARRLALVQPPTPKRSRSDRPRRAHRELTRSARALRACCPPSNRLVARVSTHSRCAATRDRGLERPRIRSRRSCRRAGLARARPHEVQEHSRCSPPARPARHHPRLEHPHAAPFPNATRFRPARLQPHALRPMWQVLGPTRSRHHRVRTTWAATWSLRNTPTPKLRRSRVTRDRRIRVHRTSNRRTARRTLHHAVATAPIPRIHFQRANRPTRERRARQAPTPTFLRSRPSDHSET